MRMTVFPPLASPGVIRRSETCGRIFHERAFVVDLFARCGIDRKQHARFIDRIGNERDFRAYGIDDLMVAHFTIINLTESVVATAARRNDGVAESAAAFSHDGADARE